MEPTTDWNPNEVMRFTDPHPAPDDVFRIEIESRLARIETKQDALYAEIHAVRLEFAKLVEGVMDAMTSNPLLSRLLGGGRKNAV